MTRLWEGTRSPNARQECRTIAARRAIVRRIRRSRALRAVLIVIIATIAGGPAIAGAEADFATERAHMVAIIEAYAKLTRVVLGRDFIAPAVLEAMRVVPRHEFVAEALRGDAYADRPLPIGYGQTISQPFIVALMTDLLHVGPDDTVLEVGTGSGYQAAVLAHLARRVYTIEIVPGLAESAGMRLQRLGYDRVVTTRTGDGYYGWEEAAPFDALVVTAASSHIPPPLIRPPKPGGRMVIPVGAPFALQYLVLIERNTADGRLTTRQLLPVSFVPLTGGRG